MFLPNYKGNRKFGLSCAQKGEDTSVTQETTTKYPQNTDLEIASVWIYSFNIY